jgi:hypothetical protein
MRRALGNLTMALLLQARRTGRSTELMAAGKDLIDYAIPGIEQPGTSAYKAGLLSLYLNSLFQFSFSI